MRTRSIELNKFILDTLWITFRDTIFDGYLYFFNFTSGGSGNEHVLKQTPRLSSLFYQFKSKQNVNNCKDFSIYVPHVGSPFHRREVFHLSLLPRSSNNFRGDCHGEG